MNSPHEVSIKSTYGTYCFTVFVAGEGFLKFVSNKTRRASVSFRRYGTELELCGLDRGQASTDVRSRTRDETRIRNSERDTRTLPTIISMIKEQQSVNTVSCVSDCSCKNCIQSKFQFSTENGIIFVCCKYFYRNNDCSLFHYFVTRKLTDSKNVNCL